MNIRNLHMISNLSIVFDKIHTQQISSVPKLCLIFYRHQTIHFFSSHQKEEELHNLLSTNDLNYDRKTTTRTADFEKICNGDSEMLRKLKILEMEIEMNAQKSGKIPKIITTEHWRKLLSLPGKLSRHRYMYSLWRFEKLHDHTKHKKAMNRNNYLKFIKPKSDERKHTKLSTNSPVEYGLTSCSLFHRINDQQMNNFYNYKLAQASIFGPHLLIDCGYESNMTSQDMLFTANEITWAWRNNREHFHPHNLIFCNLNRKGELFNIISRKIPGIENDPAFPFFHSEESYLDLFPKKRLVYLTPYSNKEMKCYDPSSLYVIGALSVKNMDHRLLLAKAKSDGLRMAKFPINYGRRKLTVTESVNILNDVKDGSDWNHAFRHISMDRSLNTLCGNIIYNLLTKKKV